MTDSGQSVCRKKTVRRRRGTGLFLSVLLAAILASAILTGIPAEAKASLKLNVSKKTIYTGQSYTIKATRKGTSKKVRWSSDKTSVATVNSSGKVTGKKAGTATITAKVGSLKATCKITVKKPTIKLSKSKASVYKGNSLTLKATVAGPSKKVTWTTSNKKIATVTSAGKVTGKAIGTATITAKANGKKAACKVTVKKKPAAAFDPTGVTGTAWECGEYGPYLTLKIYNGSTKTIYVNRYLKISNCKRVYTNRYETRYMNASLTTDGWDDDLPPIAIKPGTTKSIPYSAPTSKYWNTYFLNNSFASVYIGLKSCYQYLYVMDIGRDSYKLKYACTLAKSDAYMYSRENGNSSTGTGAAPDTNKKRTCPFCHGKGKCTNCGGSGRQTVSHTLTGNMCVTCRGSGKCQCCNGKGTY